MMVLTKLKATATLALAGLTVLGGLGFGTLPGSFAQAPATAESKPTLGPTLSDAEFLKRTCETIRGSTATPAELSYFAADADAKKRKKVVDWLSEPETARNGLELLVGIYSQELKKASGHLDTFALVDYSLDLIPAVPNADVVFDVTSRFSEEPKKEPKPATILDVTAQVQVAPKANPQLGLQNIVVLDYQRSFVPTDTDSDFLNKATTETRGSAPTRLEKEYFLADKSPKKREKLLDLLLSDAAVAKKVGPEWKAKMLSPPVQFVVVFDKGGNDWSKLIAELVTAKKTDDQIVEALTLAIVGRLATEGEKKLAGALAGKQADKNAAWAEVANALAGTEEAKKHAEKLKPVFGETVLQLQEILYSIEVKPAPPAVPEKPKK